MERPQETAGGTNGSYEVLNATTLTLTRKELAALLGITPSTVSLWVRRQLMPGPMRGTRRYSLPAVKEWLRQGSDNTPTLDPSPFEQWMSGRGHCQT